MDQARASELAAAYGADIRRWPEAEREAARAWLATPDADRLLFEARGLDAALDASRPPSPSAALRDRVIASALAAGLTPARARKAWDRLVLWAGAGWAAAACAGVVAAVGVTSHVTADAQADAVLYQASLASVDDTEVLS
jgi:hypothetical protein